MPRIKEYKWEYLSRRAEEAWLRDQPEAFAVDTETYGVDYYDKAFAMTVAWDGEAHYLELEHESGLQTARTLLARTPKWVFHNAKFDLQKLILANAIVRRDVQPGWFEDTEAIYHLLDEHGEKKLKVLARTILGRNTDEHEALKDARKKTKAKVADGLGVLPRAVVVPYAVQDAVFTWELWQRLKPQLKGELLDLYHLEMELTCALLDMEAAGMALDLEYVERTTKEYAGKILGVELRISDVTGLDVWYPTKSGQKTPVGSLNPNAWQQTLPLIQERGIAVASTSNDALKPHADADEFVSALLELRGLKKIYGTYLLAMQREQRGGIIHPNFRQHGAKTGRMSSGGAEDG